MVANVQLGRVFHGTMRLTCLCRRFFFLLHIPNASIPHTVVEYRRNLVCEGWSPVRKRIYASAKNSTISVACMSSNGFSSYLARPHTSPSPFSQRVTKWLSLIRNANMLAAAINLYSEEAPLGPTGSKVARWPSSLG